MAIRSGLGAQLGVAAETTYGTYTAPTRFLEFNNESIEPRIERIASQGIRSNSTVPRTQRWARNNKGGAGSATFEVADKGFGLLFKHALGSVAISNPGTLAYLHTCTLGDLDDLSLTVQKGVPDTGGTVRPFSFLGCVIPEFEVALDIDGLLMFTPSFDARDWTTSESLETASFASDVELFHYQQATIQVDNSDVNCTGLRFTCRHAMATERYYLDSSGTKGRPLLNGAREIGGELTFEFSDMTQVNRFLTGAPGEEVEVDAQLSGVQIESGHNTGFGVTMAKCRFDGGMVTVPGPDVITVTAPFVALDDLSAEPITLTYKTTDSAS